MKRASSSRLLGCFFLLVAGFVASAACSNQGEGERCDSLNGDDDCAASEDLSCYRAVDLTNSISDRCCPRDRTRATTAVCQTPVDTINNDAQAPADTGPATPADTGAETSTTTDAGTDAASDADASQ